MENNNLVASEEFLSNSVFKNFNVLKIDDDKNYAANCVWINGNVIMSKGFPKAKETINRAGKHWFQNIA
ncbi:hypothetical protein KJ656_09180 [bacterium]|nr:hypothetical protein [bacterium]